MRQGAQCDRGAFGASLLCSTTTLLRRMQIDFAPANGPSHTALSLGLSVDFLTRESK
jgi:hypothetical protein